MGGLPHGKNVSRPISRVLSWTVIHLEHASPRASSDLPGSHAGRMFEKLDAPLFGLAPGGVYPATSVAESAVRSYRTISPLPHRLEKRPGGIFSVALSVGSRPPGVTWRLALWSPDFPPSAAGSGQRLSGRLRDSLHGHAETGPELRPKRHCASLGHFEKAGMGVSRNHCPFFLSNDHVCRSVIFLTTPVCSRK